MKWTRAAKPRTLIPTTAPIDEADEPPLRRFFWLKRFSLLGAVLILLVFLSRAWLIHRGERRLAEEIARWKAAGLPILAEDFDSPPVPDEENAAVALSRAAAATTKDDLGWGAAYMDNEFDQIPFSTHARQLADAILAANERALAAVSEGRKLKRVRWDRLDLAQFISGSPHDLHQPDYGKLRWLANLLGLQAVRSLDRGDETEFVEALADIRTIARVLAQQPSGISDMVSISNDALAADEAMRWAHGLQLRSRDRAAVRERMVWLINEWSQTSDRGSPVRLILCREAGYVRENAHAAAPEVNLRLTRQLQQVPRTALDNAVWRFFRPQRMSQSVEQIAQLRADIPRAEAANWTAARGLAPTAPRPQWTWIEPLDSALSAVLSTPSGNDRYVQTRFGMILAARLAATSLACRLYEIDHGGREPASLQELIPTYLPAVPIDPFSATGMPIGYVRGTGSTRAFLYGLYPAGIDMIAGGAFKPVLADHMTWRAPDLVAFLDPSPPAPTSAPSSAPATQPGATAPSSAQRVNQ